MTIICALHVLREGTWIGADSRCTFGGTPAPGTAMKWSVAPDGSRAFGLAGDARTMAALRDFDWGKPPDAYSVAQQIRDIIRSDGFVGRPRNDEVGAPSYRSQYIYATPAGVWDIDGSFGVMPIDEGRLWARGSGMDFGLGADFAHRAIGGVSTEGRVRRAIEAAIENEVGCGAPVFVRRLGDPPNPSTGG